MGTWRFELLGGLRATCGETTLDGLAGRKTGALLGLLALAGGRARPREELIDQLWPDVDFDEARNRFKQTLAVLRKALEPEGVAPGSVLLADRMSVGLAPGQSVDALEFQDALRAGRLVDACALYRGELLPGFYLDVFLIERERLAALHRSALERAEPAEAPSDPASLARPAPAPPGDAFFGRESELEALDEALRRHRLVTLLGPGGTGKTRLAQELLARLPDARLVPLAGARSGRVIPEAISDALGLTDSARPTLERLTQALEGCETLLVLDNLEQLDAAHGPETVGALLAALPSLRLLVTSRVRLNLPEEQLFPLAPLATPVAPGSAALLREFPSVALFLDRAQRAGATLTGEESIAAIALLCRHLDGLPLAIELAAARTPVLTPRQLLDRLERRFDLLADKRKDRSERHASLRATLDWSWSLLAPDLQRFFTRLCVFRGSFSLEAAEAVTQEPLALDYLQSLRDASLVVAEPGPEAIRFRLLETLREYAAEKLPEAERPALERSHYDYFLARTEGWRAALFGPDFKRVMAAYRSDIDNLRAAVERTTRDAPQDALLLLLKTGSFWTFSYQQREGLERNLRAMEAVPDLEALPLDMRARLFGTLAHFYSDLQQHESSLRWHEETLALRRAELDDALRAGADETVLMPIRRFVAGQLHNIATVYCSLKRLPETLPLLLEAVAINREIANDSWLSRNLNALSFVAFHQAQKRAEKEERTHELQQALTWCDEGIALIRPLSQEVYLCHLLSLRANILLVQDRMPEARMALAEGLPLGVELEHWTTVKDCLVSACHIALTEGDDARAAQLHGAVLGLVQTWSLSAAVFDTPALASARHRLDTLPQRLGEQRHAELVEMGIHTSAENLKRLVAPLLQPTKLKTSS